MTAAERYEQTRIAVENAQKVYTIAVSEHLESKRLLQTEMHGVPVPLSTRELEVLELVRLGHQNKEIAAKLSITTRTVSFHVANLLKKHGTYSRRLL